MIASRRLIDLLPVVQVKTALFRGACEEVGIDVLIYCTFRDEEMQAVLYAHGRTTAGPKVTNARPGESFHQYRVAFDAVPVVDGKARWDDDAHYHQMGEIAESLGFEWAGRWSGKLRETAHFQYVNGLTLSDLRQGKQP